jgi:trans-aconitate 2-methyltransferase
MAWDPKIYLAFGAERTRPAAELLGRVAYQDPARVVDLGCGPGNSTALLARRWPAADIEGVDNSREMLAEAQASDMKVRWTPADIASWSPSSPVDVIFSNATFQWLPEHAKLLPRLASCVADDGVLAFQVPRNFDEPCHRLIHAVAENGPWARDLESVTDRAGALAPEAYFDILEPYFPHIDIWETRYLQTLAGADAVYDWMLGTGLRPFTHALGDDLRRAFLQEYRKRVGEAYPMRASGVTLYPFQRLFCVARKEAKGVHHR